MKTILYQSRGRNAAYFAGKSRLLVPLGILLLLVTMAGLMVGCGKSSEKTVLANPDATPPDAGGEALPASFTKDLGPLKIPPDTLVRVRLLQSISSRTASSGGEFETELVAPIRVDDRLAFPKGARVRGRIVDAHASGRLDDPGFLRLTLDAIQNLDGQWIDISTSSVSAKGKSHERRNLTLIGGGGAVGALIGGLAGGGKGAAIGAASGAAAGTAGAYATGRKDVVFAAERKLNFRTTEELVLNR